MLTWTDCAPYVRAMDYGKAYRARTIWRGTVSNEKLVELVALVALNIRDRIRWPLSLDPDQAARIAYDYVKQETRYYADLDSQYIRTPRAFVREKVGDCKTTAIFIATLARAAGHDAALKFVKLPGRSHYGHVYAVVNGIPVDPLLPYGHELANVESLVVHL